MRDLKDLLEQGANTAPSNDLPLSDLHDRRDRRRRRQRLQAGVLGMTVTAALVASAILLLPAKGGPGPGAIAGGGGLPAATRTPPELTPGGYAYQRILMYGTCEAVDVDPTAACTKTVLHMESWWALDDSGRTVVLEAHNYGTGETGRFGPGEFPDEGDLSTFPTDPEALRAFLLDRAAPDGASPRPEVTPAPGVPLDDGLLWNSIRDYLGSTQYLNATPALRAAMLRVLAEVPMVSVVPGATDPAGRAAVDLRFRAYDADTHVFVDPETGDFLAMTQRYDGEADTAVTLVEAAGFTATDDTLPQGDQRTITPRL